MERIAERHYGVRLGAAAGLATLIFWIGVSSGVAQNAARVLGELESKRGICVVLDDKRCEASIELARESELLIYAQFPRENDVAEARKIVDEAGLFGTRIVVAQGWRARIGLADDLADAVVAPRPLDERALAEAMRVLRPGGKAFIGNKVVTKPFPEGMDDWSHHNYGPDNNPQSLDQLARAPFLTNFISDPAYAPAPQSSVMSAGRVFMAFGHIAWHEREEEWLNTLTAVNGFNGAVLWTQPLPAGYMVDRSMMVATPKRLFVAGDKSCRVLDPATGDLMDEIIPDPEKVGGAFWKWIALKDGVLYALIGDAEPTDPDVRWRRERHGWGWNEISKAYNAPQYPWGFGRTLLAIDPKTKRIIWSHREEEPIDSRGLCMKNGRIFISAFGKYVASVSAKDGEELWRKTAEKNPDMFKKIGPYRPGHGYIGGWKSTTYLKCTNEAIYFVGPQTHRLSAFAADDGRYLWTYDAIDLHIVVRDDGLYTIGAENSKGKHSKKLDPMTGKELSSYNIVRAACTRSTGGPDSIYFRARGGSVRLSPGDSGIEAISPMRPSCHVGVMIGNGRLYWLPWACDCNNQVFGVTSLAPAGDFRFDQPAKEGRRLRKAEDMAPSRATLGQAPNDWSAYRFDSARSGVTSATIASKPGLLWCAKSRKGYRATAPVAAGGIVFVAGSDGAVRAFDAASGEEKWRAYTGGAISYPPAIADGRALVGSGDGWVYAFDAADGDLLWRFRAAPQERRIPVYGALLSTWPVTSGVLVEDGVAYFAAGINDYDGTHIYALDAATGAIRWQNNSSGLLDEKLRRGVSVQGEMLLHRGKLYLAGGNVVSPGIFDAATGKCLNAVPQGIGSRAPRGPELRLTAQYVDRRGQPVADGRVTVSGPPFYSRPDGTVFDKGALWATPEVRAANAVISLVSREDGKGGERWLLVGKSLEEGETLWERGLPVEPVRWGMAVDAEGRIFVTFVDGKVLCFGK